VFLGSIIIRGLDFFIRTELVPWVSSTTFSLAMGENGGLLSEVAEKLSTTVTMRALGINPLLISLTILLFLVFAPSGVMEWWGKLRSSFRIWPLSHST
jgi:hypothetical protein